MQSLFAKVQQTVQHALATAYPQLADQTAEYSLVTASTQSHFGHYQCNSAMPLAKLLHQSPRAIANQLVQQIETEHHDFAHIEVAGPGFINFTYKNDFIQQYCFDMSQENEQISTSDA